MGNFEMLKEMRDNELSTIQEIMSSNTSETLDDEKVAYLNLLWEAYNTHDKLCKMLGVA